MLQTNQVKTEAAPRPTTIQQEKGVHQSAVLAAKLHAGHECVSRLRILALSRWGIQTNEASRNDQQAARIFSGRNRVPRLCRRNSSVRSGSFPHCACTTRRTASWYAKRLLAKIKRRGSYLVKSWRGSMQSLRMLDGNNLFPRGTDDELVTHDSRVASWRRY